jgi:hypothetical protein
MLQNDIGINEIKSVSRKKAEVGFDVQMILNLILVLVILLGLPHHGGRNIHPIDSLEMLRQRLGQSSQTTTEIQRRSLLDGHAGFPDGPQRPGDFLLSIGEELFRSPFPAAFILRRENHPHRVVLPQFGPVLIRLLNVHSGRV